MFPSSIPKRRTNIDHVGLDMLSGTPAKNYCDRLRYHMQVEVAARVESEHGTSIGNEPRCVLWGEHKPPASSAVFPQIPAGPHDRVLSLCRAEGAFSKARPQPRDNTENRVFVVRA